MVQKDMETSTEDCLPTGQQIVWAHLEAEVKAHASLEQSDRPGQGQCFLVPTGT